MSQESAQAENHYDYAVEKKRLHQTVEAVASEKKLRAMSLDNVNTWLKDGSQQAIPGAQVFENDRISEAVILREIETYEEIEQAPYFYRIDFKDKKSDVVEVFYIGKKGFYIDDSSIQVIDYRSPFGGIVYSTKGTKAEYVAPKGRVSGDVSLRRRFEIEASTLKVIQDILKSERPGDAPGCEKESEGANSEEAFLVRKLSESSATKLKEIIETITIEQNEIIRQPQDCICMVQGCAGSGKSSIALHRISYLLFNNKTIKPEKVLIVAPNKTFINYIHGLSPELDIDGVQEKTFGQVAKFLLDDRISYTVKAMEDIFYVTADDSLDKGFHQSIRDAIAFWADKASADLLEEFCAGLDEEFKKKLKDIEGYDGDFVLQKDDLAAYYDARKGVPLNQKMRDLKQFIRNKLQYFLTSDDGKGTRGDRKLTSQAARLGVKGYLKRKTAELKAMPHRSSGRQMQLTLLDQKKALHKRLFDEKNIVERRVAGVWAHHDLATLYMRFLREKMDPEMKSLSGDAYGFFRERVAAIELREEYAREDLALLCLLQERLNGLPADKRFVHIVVDEAQDLSECEFMVLKRLLSAESMTLLGDIAQGIHSYHGFSDWSNLQQRVFNSAESKNVNFFEIKKNYRSSRNIVRFTNDLLPAGLPKMEAIGRDGVDPAITRIDSMQEYACLIPELIASLSQEGMVVFGVVCSDTRAAANVHQLLQALDMSVAIALIDGDEGQVIHGINIMTVEQAKGLEFDAVIVWEASEENYPSGDDFAAKRLFVACTRALHRLFIVAEADLSTMVERAQKALAIRQLFDLAGKS